VLHMRLAGSLYPVGPVDNHLASHRAYFRMDGSRELADFRSKNGKVEGGDGGHFRLRANGADGGPHSVQPVRQPLPRRPQLAAIVRQLVEALVEHRDGVEDPVEVALQMNGRCLGPLRASRRHGDKMASEVAAVYCRNVARMERLQGLRVIPVEHMPAFAWQG